MVVNTMMRLLRVPLALTLSLALPSAALAQYPLAAAPEMSEEEKIEKAKNLYMQAEGLAAEDNWEAAVVLYEQAYYLVPSKHGFAHKVGIAAWKVKQCDKAFDYLTHFVTYGEADKYPDKIAEAEGILAEIEAEQCRTAPEPEPEPGPVVEEENPFENTGETETPGEGGGKDKKKGGKGLLAGGAVLLTLGVGGLALGAAGAGMASGASSSLASLASTNTITGYPAGDYACRDPETDCPQDLESRLGTGKALGFAGFIGGGVLLVAGVALIVVHTKKSKGKASATAQTKPKAELGSVGPALLPGGGGLAASMRF